ncbi:MAG: glycosyltransferase family 2 protein [Nitriliruptorales bacterium]|nr:glycosyltransferase family 2 protein [Nitriliruptorales bacterium]
MEVTAIVVNHNSGAYLGACLDALLAQDHELLRVVVVDNASTDGSLAVLARYASRVDVVRNATNRGYAGALNDVLRHDTSDAVLVCNPDVVAAPDHVRRLAAALVADPGRGSAQGLLVRPNGRVDSTGHVARRSRLFSNRDEGRPVERATADAGAVFGVTGALALHRRAMLDDVAIEVDGRPERFDEDLFAYFEDVELDWRAATRGWTAWYEPRAQAVHHRRGASRHRPPLVAELNWRNRLLLLAKCDDLASLARALPTVVLTTAIKSLVLGARNPAALVRAVAGFIRLVPRMRRKRREVQRRASVASSVVVERWFRPFSYRAWYRAYVARSRR